MGNLDKIKGLELTDEEMNMVSGGVSNGETEGVCTECGRKSPVSLLQKSCGRFFCKECRDAMISYE